MSIFSKQKVTVYIDGMSCMHCAGRVEAAFKKLPKTSAKVNLDKKCAEVTSKEVLSDDILKETVQKVGFTFVKAER